MYAAFVAAGQGILTINVICRRYKKCRGFAQVGQGPIFWAVTVRDGRRLKHLKKFDF